MAESDPLSPSHSEEKCNYIRSISINTRQQQAGSQGRFFIALKSDFFINYQPPISFEGSVYEAESLFLCFPYSAASLSSVQGMVWTSRSPGASAEKVAEQGEVTGMYRNPGERQRKKFHIRKTEKGENGDRFPLSKVLLPNYSLFSLCQ